MRRVLFLLSVVLIVVLMACGRAGQPTAATITAPPITPGAQGWLLCLSTDRPIYHSGDTVNGRVVILDAVTFAPATTRIPVNLRLLNPRDHVTATALAWSVNGIAPFTWTLAADAVEGGYRVTANTSTPSAPAERALIVTTERTPALDLQLRQEREAWVAGEIANVQLSVRHHDGTPVPAATVRINATVDGVVVDLTATALDAVGETTLHLPLPTTFSSGVLTAIIEYHGRLEQISCQLRRMTKPLVELIPESGVLLSGISNVIYLQAWRRAGEPLALRGDLIDDQQRVITEVRTTHEGRARVIFTPQSGRQYRLLVREPSAVDNLHPLPAVLDHGVVLHARDKRIAVDQPARLDLTSTTSGQHRVELTRRGAAVASIVVPCSPRVTQALELPLPADVDGVLEATVSGPDGTRLAQRLLFREPNRRLTVTVVPDQARRGLDEDAGVTVRVVDEHGRPAAALVSVAVVDAGITTSLPPRERPPRLPVMALLENEVEHCADPAAYLGDAPALDLLLGTQAWRRLVDPRSPPPATTPTRELALRRLLMQRHVWPEWPAMLAADATAPVPGLSSRHRGLPAQPSTSSTPLPPVKPSGGATDWALNWMIRTQRGDGSWSPTHPAEEIRRDTERTGIAPWSGPDADRATTALMLLSYLGAGYDHKTPNKYKKRVAQGLAWLMTQAPDGRFSHDATVQGVVTCCLAEAYAMTDDAALKPLCELAIAAVLADQVQWQGQRLGWSATHADAPTCDADASLWSVIALKSALAGGLAIDDGLEGAKVYLTAAWTAANAGRTANDTAKLGTFPTRWDPRTNTCQLPHSPANGLLMAIFLGFHRGDARTDGLAEHVFRRYYPPQLPLPLIEDYLTTMGLFQVGGHYWDQWNRLYRDLMVNLQEDRLGNDGSTHHLRGSWDPQDFDAFAATGGRVITSAFACLSLETYYRYRAVNSKAADVKENTLAAPAQHELDAGTRLWNAAARTDPLTGSATLRFNTPPRPADLRILVDAVDARGALGSGDRLMRCGAEVTLDARLPQHLRVGDQALVPLSMRDRREPPADTAFLRLGTAAVEQLPLRSGVARRLVKLDATPTAAATGHLPIDWEVTVGDHHDLLKRNLPVGPLGFPWAQHRSGLVDAAGAAHDCLVPNDLDAESLRGTLTLYPSTAARLQDAMAGLLREPHGCFEQISATSYPMAMAERLLRTRKKPDATVQARLHGLLTDAYRQLTAYECPGGGFSWWGKSPAHPALTAFGLMQFRDLASSITADPAVLNRTRTWLLNQRDAAGCFSLTDDHPAWGRACAHTYITWALLESADDARLLAQDLAAALIAVERDAQSQANAYVVALAANALLRAGRDDAARAALKRLVCAADGSVDGATGSLLGEDRDEARRQTTALALLAWMALGEQPQALAAARYLLGTAADGAFGTTQTTVLTLRALAAFEHIRPPDADQAVTVTITIDGADLPTPVTVAATADEPLRMELGSRLSAGAHRLALRQDGTRHLPWALTLTGSTSTPPVSALGVEFFTAFNHQNTDLGGTLLLQINCRLAKDLPTPVAVIGIPAGLRPLRSALDELVAEEKIGAWELRGDLLVLYWTTLGDGHGQITVPCVAEVPGRFRGPASRLYGYYDRTRQGWSAPLRVTIAAPPGW